MNLSVDAEALADRTFVLRTTPARATSRLRRRHWQRKLASETRVHLGCGPLVLEGWANLDVGGGEGVVPFDLTARLPFEDGSVDRVFTEHFIEHVTLAKGTRFLAECARILKPGGVLRISTPDLQSLISEYQKGRLVEWEDEGWLPATPAQMFNEAMRKWGHTFVYDEAELVDSLHSVGLTEVQRVAWHESAHADLRNLERRTFHGDLILEATR